MHENSLGTDDDRRQRSSRIRALIIAAALVSSVVATGATSAAGEGSGWPGGTWSPAEPSFTMGVEAERFTMDDGVVLNALIGYPIDRSTLQRAEGPFPVVVTQNPYPFSVNPDNFFVERGYLHVVVELRGTGLSDKAADDPLGPLPTVYWAPRDGLDGATVVRWAADPANLPGSSGIVGLHGCSWLGIVQFQTAAAVGPDSPLKAILPACANNGYEAYFHGGVPHDVAPAFGLVAALIGPKHAPENYSAGEELSTRIMAGEEEAYDRELPDGTPGFWQQRDMWRNIHKIVDNDIPALLWTGWQSLELATGGADLYTHFQRALRSSGDLGPMDAGEASSGRYHIIVSDTDHGGGLDKTLQLLWFDTWLKGQDTGIDRIGTGLHLMEIGGDRWVNHDSWPMTDQYRALYLSDGELSPTRPPSDVDTVGFGDPEEAGNALTYESEPFAEDQTIGGPIASTIRVSSSNENAHIVVRLFDVAPDGSETEISRGSLIGSSRHLHEARSWRDANGLSTNPRGLWNRKVEDADALLVPDQRYTFEIRMFPTLYRLGADHTLKLVLSSNFPSDVCGGSTSWPAPCSFTDPQAATLTDGEYEIHTGGAEASSIQLPLFDPDDLTTARSATTATSTDQTQPLDWGHPTALSTPSGGTGTTPPAADPEPSEQASGARQLPATGGGGHVLVLGLGAAVAAIGVRRLAWGSRPARTPTGSGR